VHTPPNGVNILIIVNYALANLARVTLHFALNFCEQNIEILKITCQCSMDGKIN